MLNEAGDSRNRNVSVIISFLKGSFEDGFSVSTRVLEDGTQVDQRDPLNISEVSEIRSKYTAWRQHYLEQGRSVARSARAMDLPPAVTAYSSIDACREASIELANYLERQWFGSVEFQALKDWIRGRTIVHLDRSVPVFFEFNTGLRQQDVLLRKLPWSRWDLFKELSNAEPALGIAFGKPVESTLRDIRVLLILGSDEGGLDLDADESFVSDLTKIGAQVKRLSCPDARELYSELKRNQYDILFFAGHSLSEEDQRDGTILLKPRTLVSIDSLSPSLQAAVQKGLKLAIFNSCDGLGLADPLLRREKIPAVIAFREPVPDEVARTFLKYFLEEFSSGNPLFLSVREARNQLRFLEDRYDDPLPSASWLPVVCQNPSQPEILLSPTDKMQQGNVIADHSASIKKQHKSQSWKWKVGAAAVLLLVTGIAGGLVTNFQSLFSVDESQIVEPDELEYVISTEELDDLVSEGDKIILTSETSPGKKEGVKAYKNGDWEGAINDFRRALNSESEKGISLDPETWIYLNNAIAARNTAAGNAELIQLAVVVSVPELISEESTSYNRQLQGQAAELLRGVALLQSEFNCTVERLASTVEDLDSMLQCNGREGRFVHITIADDTSFEDAALSNDAKRSVVKSVASKLSEHEIQAVIGHFSSSNCEAAGEIYKSKQIVMISPTCTKTSLTDNEYFFRTIPNDQIAAEELANSSVDGRIISEQEVAIAYAYGSTYAQSFRDAFEEKLEDTYVSVCESIDAEKFDSEVCTQQTNEASPTFLLLTAPSSLRVRTLAILDSLDEDIIPLGSDSMYGPEAISQEYAERVASSGLLIYVSWHPDPNIRTLFENRANRLFGISNAWNWRTQSSYDATSSLAEGIRDLGNGFSGARLKERLKADSFSADGVLGRRSVKFNADGERILEGAWGKIGTFVRVVEELDAQGRYRYTFEKVDE